MHFLEKHPSKPMLLTLTLVTLLAASSISLSFRGKAAWWNVIPSAFRPAATPDSSSTQSSDQSKTPAARTEAVVLTIRRNGIEPSEIIRPKGPFLLVVNNRSGVRDVALQLGSDQGAALKAKSLVFETGGWHEWLDLSPGSFVISEATHRDWTCKITITAK